ncbi:MAG TPA: hypothetical protein VK420_03335, partial [Longimicrobium sp.]|nr:hypothetical protein [Longimicrobium sp.]
AALAVAAFAVLRGAGFLSPEMIWLDAVGIAVKLGVMGGIVGGAFSLAIGTLYRGRRLSEMSALRFGLGGGIMAGLFVPLFLQTTSLLSGGGPVPMELIFDDAILAALFGAVAAGGSLRLAQRTEPMLPETVRPGLVGSGDPLGGTRRRNAAAGQRVG